MGKHKKKKLDADRTDHDDQDKASFSVHQKKKSKSMSDRELELSSTEVYDEVYKALTSKQLLLSQGTRVCKNNDEIGKPLFITVSREGVVFFTDDYCKSVFFVSFLPSKSYTKKTLSYW